MRFLSKFNFMYYEEKRIDGIWHFRITPKGEWQVMGFVNLNEKIRQLEKEIEILRGEMRSLNLVRPIE